MKLKEIFVLAICILVTMPVFSQHSLKDKKYIFELDITKSMWGVGEPGSIDIFDKVRNQLITAIEGIQDPSAEIVLITWQDQIINTWQEKATQQGKENLITQLKEITKKSVPGQNTNIYNAWVEAKKHVVGDKINIVYLLTDGRHSVSNPPITKLYNEIPKWSSFVADKDAYMFVVELTSQAIDEKMRSQIEATDHVNFIHGIEFYTLFINNSMSIINLDENLQFELSINKQNLSKTYDNLKLRIKLESDLFDVVNDEVVLNETPKIIKLRLKKTLEQTKASLAEVSYLPVTISIDQEDKYSNIKLVNSDITCKIVNKKEKVLYFKEL
ncbi:vWA domain-containing protein [Myroides pelagicus]|uniref:VWA domain-containing protein n=1 Tax=Myroides pelagicus TaxID=270914 RepID=A0A7K1GKZ8_9FLAO|nr:VWA domain-containing protein [Myroides pelagicus]MTH29209.1 hypothetical protein [Myroides pelagicus]